jgi:hypothetical protein
MALRSWHSPRGSKDHSADIWRVETVARRDWIIAGRVWEVLIVIKVRIGNEGDVSRSWRSCTTSSF